MIIEGNDRIAEGASGTYSAYGILEDGRRVDVTEKVIWTDHGSPYCEFDPGVKGRLNNTNDTKTDHSATIHAEYNTGTVMLQAEKTIVLESGPRPATIVGLIVLGAELLPDLGAAQYQAIASWSDGTTTDITEIAVWTDGGSALCEFDPYINGRLVNTNTTGVSQQATIAAEYDPGTGRLRSEKTIIVESIPKLATVVGLGIVGEEVLVPHATVRYEVLANWSDGTSTNVTAESLWDDGASPFCRFDPAVHGTLTNTNESGVDQYATISASYTNNGVTLSATKRLLLKSPVITGLAIRGAALLPRGTAEQYLAQATYSDGAVVEVTNRVLWEAGQTPHCHFDAAKPGRLLCDYAAIYGSETVTVYAKYVGQPQGGVTVASLEIRIVGQDDYEPDDSLAQATPITDGGEQTHSISPQGDVDWIQFEVTAEAEVNVFARRTLHFAGDGVQLRLYDANLNELENDTGGGTGELPSISRTATTGRYYAKFTYFGTGRTGLVAQYDVGLSIRPVSGPGRKPSMFPGACSGGTSLGGLLMTSLLLVVIIHKRSKY